MNGTETATPPKARRAFRVGVVGHRLDRLPQDADKLSVLGGTLSTILGEVRKALLATDQDELAQFYTADPPILRAVSPLAEGTDRIFADAALAWNYELCCPLPFYQEEFEQDFVAPDSREPGSLAHFRAILEKARNGAGLSIFEMDGDRARAPEAYGAAGRVVLSQSDLLIVVWDGDKARGAGGTLDTLGEALDYNVPVIRIDSSAPDQCRLLRARQDCDEALDNFSGTLIAEKHMTGVIASIVHKELRLPKNARATPSTKSADAKSAGGHVRRAFAGLAARACPAWDESGEDVAGAEQYFAEQKRSGYRGFLWKLFRNAVADWPPSWPVLSIEDFIAQVRKEWPVASDGAARPSPVADWINMRLRAAFAWADGLADYYGNAHRSGFIESYLLAAFAVFVALLPVGFPPHSVPHTESFAQGTAAAGQHWLEILCGLAELVILSRVLFLLYSSRRRQWHERWTDYRLLAELIRELRFMVPLGGGRPLPRIPPHLEVYGNPAQTWMYWYVRAIARETGIPAARVTSDYVRDCLDFLDRVVGEEESGQRGFHVRAERRARNLDKRLRCTANLLFGLTIVGVIFRLILAACMHAAESWRAGADRWLLVAAAVLPALGAALEGINNQGEFIRVAKRSAAMAGGFRRFAARIARLRKGPPPRLAEIVPLSRNIAQTMVAEVVDWRAVFIDRQ